MEAQNIVGDGVASYVGVDGRRIEPDANSVVGDGVASYTVII
jgi:hypothetical protein